ncbi:hypothetical protein JYA63_07950 [Fictibacillus nanhaiensis]|uniref:Polysaccharide chain length determinant N-terminal domain-containing protein n=1 Tax=Fictibacillus nanhaiensis TaxID=742169 RepID=A0ABS2ZNH8_9BACL|nr:hypothetical protein [Fictibacillus nanhaiensis]
MSLLENESIKRILIRFKKLFFVLLLLPIIFAGLGYFLGMNEEATYTAKAEIRLGEFIASSQFTNVGEVQDLLKNENYLSNLNVTDDPIELASKTNPIIKPRKVIELSYSSDSKKESEKVLQKLVNAFLKDSNDVVNDKNDISYMEWKDILEGQIKELEDSNDANKTAEISDRKEDLEKLRPTQIEKDVYVEETNNNPLRKAILGFLVGLMFSISILLFPEVIRK